MAKPFDIASVLRQDTGREQIEYVPLESLVSDSRNFYSLSGLDDLAANIELLGLQQPIRVRRDPDQDGKYIIVSGHRRRAAIEMLAAESPEKWREVPVIVEQDPGSPEMQELRLIYANCNTRSITSAEISQQAARVEQLLYELKEQGVEFPGRMRDHVAQAVGVSKSKLARLKVIRENLIPQFMRLWNDDALRESTAYTLAGQTPAWQRAVWIAQTKEGTQKFSCTDGWLETIFREMDRTEKLCKIPCSVLHTSSCDHIYTRLNRAAGLQQYCTMPCSGCCRGCSSLAGCSYSCEYAGDVKKELRDKYSADRKKSREEQKKKERPEKEMLELSYSRAAMLRDKRNIADSEYLKTSNGYMLDRDQKRLEDIGCGKAISLNDRMPGGIWAQEALRLVAVADLLGCSIDYLLGRTDTPELITVAPPENVPKLGTGSDAGDVPNLGTDWRTGVPEEPGEYIALVQYCRGDELVPEKYKWTGQSWEDYDCDICELGIAVPYWMPLPED